MLNVPPELVSAYNGFLVKKGIPQKNHPFYRKWLRYYLDFCQKFSSDRSNENSLSAFIAKLQDKKQSEFMQKQARHAVSVFHKMQAGSKKCGGDDRQAKANSLANIGVKSPCKHRGHKHRGHKHKHRGPNTNIGVQIGVNIGVKSPFDLYVKKGQKKGQTET